ncbi:hypothetical protein Glove_114g96 [Diversispora epigaea]|uniref:Uncharacterized protein n=1 Tax=Diversispora epigaea TaxID=1348612 RepID=A0A397J3R9_9GLOM|nr:hypothetical protein Glove_114g96 [Diversispora epigaea]
MYFIYKLNTLHPSHLQHMQNLLLSISRYRYIENNFELDLWNRTFLFELDTKELNDNELGRLTMFSTSLDSVPLHTKTTSLSFKHKCPVLNQIEWRDNCQFPVIHKGEILSDWKKQIWNQLIV